MTASFRFGMRFAKRAFGLDGRVHPRFGELTMQVELLEAKAGKPGPLARRRSLR